MLFNPKKFFFFWFSKQVFEKDGANPIFLSKAALAILLLCFVKIKFFYSFRKIWKVLNSRTFKASIRAAAKKGEKGFWQFCLLHFQWAKLTIFFGVRNVGSFSKKRSLCALKGNCTMLVEFLTSSYDFWPYLSISIELLHIFFVQILSHTVLLIYGYVTSGRAD